MQAVLTQIPMREILHFLGWRGTPVEPSLTETIRQIRDEALRRIEPRVSLKSFDILPDGLFSGTGFTPEGNDVRGMLASSCRAVLMAATLGAESERMLLREQARGAADALILTSPDRILDWDVNNCAKAWVSYVKNGDMPWCYDGYYRKSPENYIPTGTNYYYCCAASYCIRGFLSRTPPCREAPALTILALDTMALRQNSFGYWATDPGSEWLQSDYGIGPGFYDTRFNTELLELYLKAAHKFGGNLFEAAVERYLAFYTQFADTNHITTESGGWLIPDYWHPDTHITPHTSLNHQVTECLALYHAAELLDREDLFALADRMLLAIEDTGSRWVMPDHNLYYSIQPNGTYTAGDYPYLTYNDLLHLREYLTESGRAETETLTHLIGEKLQWMVNNGVTGYETD